MQTPPPAPPPPHIAGDWSVVIHSDEDGASVIDRHHDVIAHVEGETQDAVLARALLIACAPTLRDSATTAVPLLRAFATTRRGRVADTAWQLVSELENAIDALSAQVNLAAAVH